MNQNLGNQETNQANINIVLEKYLSIQKQEQTLKEEKAELQKALAEHMSTMGRDQWYPDINGRKLKVKCRESTILEYNEELLQERLADKYLSILEPDIRKIRKNLVDVSPLLQPIINIVGSPSAEKVRSAIEAGILQKNEFKGAFTKTIKRNVSVSQIRP